MHSPATLTFPDKKNYLQSRRSRSFLRKLGKNLLYWVGNNEVDNVQVCIFPTTGQKKIINFSLCYVYFEVAQLQLESEVNLFVFVGSRHTLTVMFFHHFHKEKKLL